MGRLKTFPVSVQVAGRRVVVVGSGEPAAGKLRLLAKTEAEVHVYAAEAGGFAAMEAARHGYRVHALPPGREDMAGAALVFIGTEDSVEDQALAGLARAAGVPVNVVDRPALCDVLTPAFVDRAPVTVAISTEGAAPVLAGILRTRIEALLPPGLGRLAELAGGLRARVAELLPPGRRRLEFWRRYFGTEAMAEAAASGASQARQQAMRLIDSVRRAGGEPGVVWFVGSVPGATDLLTLRAQRVLAEADVVVQDAGIDAGVLDLVRRDAKRIVLEADTPTVGSAGVLLAQARSGAHVVRLSHGDVIGHPGHRTECGTLAAAGINWAVVPGLPAQLGDRGTATVGGRLEEFAA
jgi:uroporphyrin-III C-methyltransferase / precorrin-2 dehydrogenase / sirohydrochlorin ferrochelatase